MTNKSILIQAIEAWGVENQINLAQEECAELIVALSHNWRGREANVVEEIADVQILLDQLKCIFGVGAVEIAIDKKMERLKERLANKETSFDYQPLHIGITI